MITSNNFGINKHCKKFWQPGNFLFLGTNTTLDSFFSVIKSKIDNGLAIETEGYASFCRNIIVKNDFVENVPATVMEITPENDSFLRTKYQRRGGPDELEFLIRYFCMSDLKEAGLELNQVPYFCLEFYSKEHLINEDIQGLAKNYPNVPVEDLSLEVKQKYHYAFDDPNTINDWVCINIKMQIEDKPIPMAPQTIIVNALGPYVGGSGAPLKREKYEESVNFFKKYAFVDLNL